MSPGGHSFFVRTFVGIYMDLLSSVCLSDKQISAEHQDFTDIRYQPS